MWDVTAALCLVWAATLLYGEMFAFWMPPLFTCSWPHLHSTIDGVDHSIDYTKVAVLTDPQIMDRTSLKLAPESLALEMAKFYTDLYMRRVMLSSVLPFQPDIILFLGDYFDGGLVLADDEWQDSLSRFKHIFNLNMIKRSTNIPIMYLPGNHDVGYAAFNSRMPEVIKRYEKEFHSRNYRFKVGSVDFIAIDAQTIDGNPQGNLTSATWEFVKNTAKDVNLSPRVLLSHIPLYRPDMTSCGSHRSSPIINQRITRAAQNQEIIYQNYITEESSSRLLDIVKPGLILSGHDHDQCTVTHLSKHGPVIEHTVGSVSWQQGNLYPSFMLLSAYNNASEKEDAVLTNLCFLPLQLYIYIWYICLFVLTLGVLLLWPTNGLGLSIYFVGLLGYFRSLTAGGAMKEKIDDDNDDYDIIWDAEGTMHLIKKPVKKTPKISSDTPLMERGNAVIRPTAKKQMSQEIETEAGSVSLDMNIQASSDQATEKLKSKINKSKTRFIIQRLVRVVKMLTVIAAVNFPLYVMLLFKDWADK